LIVRPKQGARNGAVKEKDHTNLGAILEITHKLLVTLGGCFS